MAAAIRSEREAKPSGAAIVEHRAATGRLFASSLESAASTPKHREFFRALMTGLGVKLLEPKPVAGGVFDARGYLTIALVVGPFTAPSYEQALDTDFLQGEAAATPRAGDKAGEAVWQEFKAGVDALFTFNPLTTEQYQITRLSLRKGWNSFLIKVVNSHGNWQLKARLQCRDPSLAPLLQSAVTKPSSD